jgi:hypothetical protein
MTKRYEDEIRDILKGMDRFPGEGERSSRRRTRAPWLARRSADPRHLMGGALLLTLCAWVIGGPWSKSYAFLVALAGWTQMVGLVLFVVAFVLLFRQGAFTASSTYGSAPQRWRGNVIEMPRRAGPFSGTAATIRGWWRRLAGPRRPPQRW